jgi:uncharacterized protein (TIGR00369 family)
VVTARGELMHLDDVMALVEIHVRDANDRLVAHGTSRCSVFSPIADSIRLPAPAESAPATQPDPYERPAPPQAYGRAPADGDGLGRLRARLRGELSSPPVDQLTGMRLVTADPGRVVFALAANPWLRNEWGTVYGGMLTLLAKSAAAAAAQTTAPAGTGCNALDIKINFLRPVPADGRDIVATGTVLHRGKRLAIATSELTHGDLRVAVLTGSTALTPP